MSSSEQKHRKDLGLNPRSSEAQRLEEEEPTLNLGVTSEAKGKNRREGQTEVFRRGSSQLCLMLLRDYVRTKKGRFGEKIIKDLDKNHLSVEMSAEVLFESGIMECEEKEKMYNKVLLLLTI